MLFILGLHRLPLADATAMTFLAPLFIMAISVPVLGERVGMRRWIAAAVGLAGVLLIVRPGSGAFHAAAFLPVGSAVLWACTVVATRMMSDTERPQTTLVWSAVTGFVFLSAIVPFDWVAPDMTDLFYGAVIGIASTVGQWVMIRGYGKADASVLAPFSYTQLIWASAFGLLVFGVLPGPWTIAGAAIIAGSGLYIAHRERVRARSAA
jgi:drug/metabolite transporter (DMT)-like permease